MTIEEAWRAAEAAFDLPDDGIVAWSVELHHGPEGWVASAWRSDTIEIYGGWRTDAATALRALVNRARP